MFARKLCLVAMIAALLAGGLAGCRSRRRPPATPNASATRAYAPPASTVTYPRSGPTQPLTGPPTIVARTPGMPPPPTTSYPTATVRSRTVPTRPPLPETFYGGSPDGMVASPQGSYPVVVSRPAAPSSLDGMPGGTSTAIVESANRTAQLDTRIAQLSNRVEELSKAMADPAPPAPYDEAPTRGLAAGADERAAAFADQLRGRVKGDVSQNGSVVVVRLRDAFLSGSDKLKKNPQLVATLLTTADALANAGAREVLVVGHTDGDPIKKSKWRDNKHLSEARAQRVAAELSRRGVAASSLEVVGEGSSQPLVTRERTKADKAKNRRVEVHVRF